MGLRNTASSSITHPTGPGGSSLDLEKLIGPTKQELLEKLSSDPKEYFAEKMGSYLHEEWRKTRLKEDGTYEPRIKKSKDSEWIQKHGTDEVDIANTKFEDLPSDWQYENLEAAKVAVDLVYEKVSSGEEISPEMIENLSSVVHEKWLERNDRVYNLNYGNPILTQPYNALPEDEKAKDRAQILLAIDMIKSEK